MNESSAGNAKQFCDVRVRNARGRPTIILVPGHEGREFFVFIHRNNTLVVHCNEPGVWGNRGCKSNSGDHICHHALVALEVAAEDQGMTLSWCESETAAEELARTGGKVFHAKNRQGTGEAWGVIVEDGRENDPEAVLAHGRALLRGEDVEEI